MSQALWAEPARSQQVSLETLSAVALLGLPDDRTLERSTSALLQRAYRDGTGAAGPGIRNSFYRLSPEERVVLSGLHQARWSYARLARILGKTSAQVAELAWSARLYLISVPGQQRSVPHPTGSGRNAIHCPEYEPKRPWTQTFLDEETPLRDRPFLQEHLLACATCRQALSSCKQVYYAVDSLIPRIESREQEQVRVLQQVVRRSNGVRDPLTLSFWQSFRIFLERGDIQVFMTLGVVVLLVLAHRLGSPF